MMKKEKTYICIDLKSFYASVECVERGLDPMTTKLVVADPTRTEKTICLAITPALKALGIKNRCRVFEIPKSIDYIMAAPRMQTYIDYSANIYSIYLKYISCEDIHVYSIDEVFMDVTDYLDLYGLDAINLAKKIMADVLNTVGITATAGIGSNMYLAKIAMDIMAKRMPEHIGVLNEDSYKELLWNHLPLTDFWRIGPGTVRRLEKYGMFTMKDIADADEDLLYRIFGIDAELLIDHAWGRETTTIKDIKEFKPRHNSITSGQVLSRDYEYEEGCLIVKEMAELLCLDLVDKGLITESITMNLIYSNSYGGETLRGSIKMSIATSSSRTIIPYVEELYRRIAAKDVPLRKLNISFNDVRDERYVQYDLFTDPEELEKEKRLQKAMISMRKKYGKNAILKGMNLKDGGTTIERNSQIGGHRSGE